MSVCGQSRPQYVPSDQLLKSRTLSVGKQNNLITFSEPPKPLPPSVVFAYRVTFTMVIS